MALLVRCDRCDCELSGVTTAYLLRYDDVCAWNLTTQNRTATNLLADGDNVILCDRCMDKFTEFLNNYEPTEA